MKAKALVRFNAFNFTAEAGNVIEFEREQDAKMLLDLGWIEMLNESQTKGSKK